MLQALVRAGAAALAAALLIAAGSAPQTRAIDPGKSSVRFSVQHVYVERVNGTMPLIGGIVVLPADSALPTSVSVTLDATKIRSGDEDRDGALQAPDWFDTKRFPVWTFASTAIHPTGPAAFTMDGILTIHGVAQPQRVDVTIGGTPERPLYHGLAHVERHAFGMTVTRLDPVIGQTIDVILDVALK